MSIRYRPRVLVLVLAGVLLAACRGDGSRGPATRIESLAPTELPSGIVVAAGPDAVAAFGEDLTAASGARLLAVADEGAALDAVRRGEATAAIVRLGGEPPGDGLRATDVQTVPVALFVPFTFPVEEVTVPQARELAAGRVRDWRELGGPALAVEVAAREPAAVGQALGATVTAAAVEDPAAALAGRRGRVVLAAATHAGPLAKALRVDGRRPGEEGYPFALRWAVLSAAGDERGPALGRALAGRASARAGREVVLDAVGDIMLDRAVGASIAQRGARYPFEAVLPLFAGSDIRFANLELPLTERGRRAHKDYTFRAPPMAVDGLTGVGINLLTLANNHALDYGAEGLLDTLAALDRAGIPHAGAGRNAEDAHAPALVTVNGLRIALLGYVNTPNDSVSGWVAESMTAGPGTPGVAWGTVEAVRRDVAAAKAKADIVVVALHAGFEYTGPPNAIQRALAYAAVDAGAALVLGAHPHVLQGIEIYKGVPIAYSLGNFVFDLDDDDRRQPGLPSVLSCVLRVRLGPEGVRSLEVRPAIIDQRDGRPVPASGAAARPVYERLYALTDALASGR